METGREDVVVGTESGRIPFPKISVSEDRIRKKITQFVIRMMQAAQIPISISPFWYPKLRANRNSYRPYLQQWTEDAKFDELWKEEDRDCLILKDAAYILFGLARQASRHQGEIWECGVYRGSTARLLACARDQNKSAGTKTIRLFDTFSGMPESHAQFDSFKVGSLSETSLERVRAKLKPHDNVVFHAGFIPETFAGLEDSSVSFAHIDVDQYETTKQCCSFIFPRMREGATMVIDDYGRPGTVGARFAADQYFEAFGMKPVALDTGQALIFK